MSQKFKLRFDQMRDGDPTSGDAPATESSERHFFQNAGHTRNLSFTWPDTRRLFLNYAYLVAGEYDASGPINQIRLSFSSHVVLIEGYGLEPLFLALLDHLPRIIQVVDERYVTTDALDEPNVVSVTVTAT